METPNDIKDIKYNNNNTKKRKKKSFRKIQRNAKDLITFVTKNVRYFVAGALFVLMTVVVAFFTDIDEQASTLNVNEDGSVAFEVNAHEDVNALIESYYEAYAAGDIDTLTTLAKPFSEQELAYISVLSQYVDSYENMTYYTKPGLDSNSYMVNVYVDVKFTGVDTFAPGLDFFYVRTSEDGTLYIDNLYCLYNLQNKVNPLDTNIHSMILEHKQQEDLLVLLAEVQAKYDAAMASDENLNNMLSTTIPNAVSEWMASIVAGEVVTEEPAPETETTEIPETQETETVEPESEAESESESAVLSFPEGTVITIEEATNVRKEMSAESALVETLYMGEKVTVVMSYAEGWTKVEWKNKTGYIRTDLLQ